MMYSMYVKWRIAAIAVILVFLSLPNGMDLLHRGMFSLGAGVVPLWILPSGGVEPDDEGLSWSKFFLGWPTLVMYAVLAPLFGGWTACGGVFSSPPYHSSVWPSSQS